ncbi:hypothetical protein ACQZ6C_10795 [Rhizobium rhizogenes]
MAYPSNDGPEELYEDNVAEAALYAELEGKTVQEILREGQKALFIDLVVKVRAGKANHNEKGILRNLLKDNGLVLGIPPEKPAEQSAPVDLPDFEKPDYE